VIARCLLMRAQMEFWRGRCAAARGIAEQLRPRASSLRAMLRRQLAIMYGADLVFGSASPDEAEEIIGIGRSLVGNSLFGRITELHLTAIVHAYRDEPAEFDATTTELNRIWEDMGDPAHRFIHGQGLAEALRWLGRFDEANVELWRTKKRLDAQGETSFNATITALLAVVECEQGRDEEAAKLLREAWPMTSEDDFAAHAQCRWTDAWLAAKQGRHAQAITTLDEAVAVLEGSDYLNMHADTYRYRGEVFRLAGDEERAQAAFAHAFEFWDRKGNLAAARTLRARLV
jgi:tetratricopeptide (TPR) repeat protein